MNQNSPAAEISIRNLKKNFGDLTAVDDISFDIYKGEIFGFLGPNGAGKSTTINMICGLLPPTSGEIEFIHHPGHDPRNRIGYCPQENIFYPKLTCFEQVMFMGLMYGMGRETVKKRSLDLLHQLGLTDKKNVLASKLSGGMKRRLNICLSIVHDPGILVLDEPEAGLDPQSRVLVRNFILSLAKQKTIILTTHNMDEADRLSDRVAIIDHGKLLLTDTPENLKRSIGEGDILELELEMIPGLGIEKIVESVSNICRETNVIGNTLILKSINLLGLVPVITEKIRNEGAVIGEIKLRENSLEDVFIYLTGRKLRQ